MDSHNPQREIEKLFNMSLLSVTRVQRFLGGKLQENITSRPKLRVQE